MNSTDQANTAIEINFNIDQIRKNADGYFVTTAEQITWNQKVRVHHAEGYSGAMWIGKQIEPKRFEIFNYPLAKEDGTPFLVI